MSQRIAVWSADPVRIFLPSDEKATENIEVVCPLNTFNSFPFKSQSLADGSEPNDPVRKLNPSGENATELIALDCPFKAVNRFPFMSHNRAE